LAKRIWGIEHHLDQKAERTGKGKRTPETPGSEPLIAQYNLEGSALKKSVQPGQALSSCRTSAGKVS